jgi:hypothetical protein
MYETFHLHYFLIQKYISIPYISDITLTIALALFCRLLFLYETTAGSYTSYLLYLYTFINCPIEILRIVYQIISDCLHKLIPRVIHRNRQ